MDRKFYSEKLFRVCLMMVMFISTATFAQAPCTNTVISSFTPASAPAGTIVTLNGTGFTIGAGTTAIKFNGVDAAYSVVSDTQITATLPAGNTTGAVTVTTNGCQAISAGFTVLATNCTTTSPEIYISELYDHTPGSYGVIELYNPSPTNTITFNGEYVLERYGDIGAASPSYTLILSGSIAPESTYLVLSYGTGVLGCNVPTNALMGTGINENDEIKLKKNNVIIDISRAPNEIGYTVIRKPNAVAPTTAYNANDWTFNSTQSCADLGSHTADPVSSPVTITTQPADVNICGNINTATFSVAATNASGATYQWKTLDANGNWINANGTAYSGSTTPTLTVTTSAALNNTQYYVVITTSACTAISDAAQLVINPMPQATYVITDATCTNPKGSIALTPTAGTGLNYSINGGAYQADATFANLDPGTYTINIKSDAGCITTIGPLTVSTPPAAPAAAVTTLIQPDCTLSTGTITIVSPLGLQYSLNGGEFQTGITFTGLEAGSYNLTVQNAAGCTSVVTVVINTAPLTPAVPTATPTQPNCSVATGSITVDAPIGIGYQYSINGGANQSSTTFTGLTPNTYIITVQNAAGCTAESAPIVINTAPVTPATAIATLTQPTCTAPTGTIEITAPTGTGYQYSLNGGAFQSETTFIGLAPDTYTVTIQNTDGCTSAPATFVINTVPNAPAQATAILTQPTCAVVTGTIEITAPVGTGLLYSLNGGTFQSETTFSGLTANTSYIITVQNADGCTSAPATFVIDAIPAGPAVADATLIQPTCTTATGTLTITTPTASDLQYRLNDGAYQSGTVFTGLTPGSYTITVQNAEGCTSTSAAFIINAQPVVAPATATLVQPTCSTATGSITVSAPLATGYTYSLNSGTPQTETTFTNLIEGSYTITVQTPDGCSSTSVAFVINAQPTAPAEATASVQQPDCASQAGTITVTAPLGTGFQYSINGGTFQQSATFTSLTEGSYVITVQNSQGCTSDSNVFIVNPTQGGQPELTGTQGCRPSITGSNYMLEGLAANNSFDVANATFEWRVSGQSAVIGSENLFNVTQYTAEQGITTQNFPLTFELTVTTPGGCEDTLTYTVDGIFCDIPRGISPNNDTDNDNFDLTGMNVSHLSIFNRYGLEVYKRDNYKNEWHGQTDNGNDLPTGTYFYVVKTASTTRTGWVYINRQN